MPLFDDFRSFVRSLLSIELMYVCNVCISYIRTKEHLRSPTRAFGLSTDLSGKDRAVVARVLFINFFWPVRRTRFLGERSILVRARIYEWRTLARFFCSTRSVGLNPENVETISPDVLFDKKRLRAVFNV